MIAGCGGATEHAHPATELAHPWTGDVETGDLSQFEDTPWDHAGGAGRPQVVSDPALVRNGRYALAVTIPGVYQGPSITEHSRNEIEPRVPGFAEGDERWFRFATLLGAGFPNGHKRWQVLAQWTTSGKHSPLEFSIERRRFRLSGGYGHPDLVGTFAVSLGSAETEVWSDWVARISFFPDPEVGEVEVWRDGVLVLPTFRPWSGTMYPPVEGESASSGPTSSLKIGYYRHRDIDVPGTVYFDDWKVGASASDVGFTPST